MPAFHRAVRKVHRNVHEMRHGKLDLPPEEDGGTYIESMRIRSWKPFDQSVADQRIAEPKGNRGGMKKFMELFWEELGNGSKAPPKR